jgi:hypothetical protein
MISFPMSVVRICISAAPAALDRYPRGFTGHVAHPSRSIQRFIIPRVLKDGRLHSPKVTAALLLRRSARVQIVVYSSDMKGAVKP